MNLNFAELKNKSFDDASRTLRRLDAQSKESLQSEVAAWGEEELKEAHRTLGKYYHTTVPSPLLKEVLRENLDMAYEVYTLGVSDTSPREILMDLVLTKIGVGSWPINGASDEEVNAFYEQFKVQGVKAGLTYQPA